MSSTMNYWLLTAAQSEDELIRWWTAEFCIDTDKQAPYTTVTTLSGNIAIFIQVKKKLSLTPLSLYTDDHASITCNVDTNAHTYVHKQKSELTRSASHEFKTL